jgi:pheromone shutdown protein TraB
MRKLGAVIGAADAVGVALLLHRLVQTGSCVAGTTTYQVSRPCPKGGLALGFSLPLSVVILLIALWLIGARTLAGAVIYQAFFLAISAGLLVGTLQYADGGQRLLGIGLSLIMAPIGSTFLIIVLTRRRRERADSRSG